MHAATVSPDHHTVELNALINPVLASAEMCCSLHKSLMSY